MTPSPTPGALRALTWVGADVTGEFAVLEARHADRQGHWLRQPVLFTPDLVVAAGLCRHVAVSVDCPLAAQP